MLASLMDRWTAVLPRTSAVAIVCVSVAALSLQVLRWQNEAATNPVASRPQLATPDPVDPLPVILSGGVFGSASASPASTGAPARQATGYRLRAAFAGNAGRGSAIIEPLGAQARWYEVGALLPDGARLREVYADHVVLERSGAAERLDFPRLEEMTAPASIPGSSAPTTGADIERGSAEPIPADATPEDKARIIRQRLEELRNRSRT